MVSKNKEEMLKVSEREKNEGEIIIMCSKVRVSLLKTNKYGGTKRNMVNPGNSRRKRQEGGKDSMLTENCFH